MAAWGKHTRGSVVLDKDGVPYTGTDSGIKHLVDVALYDGGGNLIDLSGLASTVYLEGEDADASFKGTLIICRADDGMGGYEFRAPWLDDSERLVVNVDAALPSGANNIGEIDANIQDNLGNQYTSVWRDPHRCLPVTPVNTSSEAKQIDEASATVTYVGWAVPGTAVAASSWKIVRITETAGDFAFEWADGDGNYDNQWSNHAALSYS